MFVSMETEGTSALKPVVTGESPPSAGSLPGRAGIGPFRENGEKTFLTRCYSFFILHSWTPGA